MTDTIPVTLKWGKQTFSLSFETGEAAALSFKQRVQAATGVPIARQKLLAKKGWKGALKDDTILKTISKPLIVTLIGSAETLNEPATKTKFLEDLTDQEKKQQEQAEWQAAMGNATGMIQALQLSPLHRDDRKQELYQYNRLVTGLPQRQIEQELQRGELQGKVAMNLGLELRRAYVNDLAVLEDGTCVSALDDGHVHLWKHACQQEDVVHPGPEGPVNSVVALKGGAFATAGRGSVQLWNSEAEPTVTLPGAMPGTTPASLTKVLDGTVTCLAARFQITRQSNPQQFRLPPQTPAEQQRRAAAQAQEQAIQTALAKASRSIQVWYGNTSNLQSQILEPPSEHSASPIICLSSLSLPDGSRLLIAGDTAGGLRLWKVQQLENGLQFEHAGFYRLPGSSVVCMEALQHHRLAIATDISNNTEVPSGATPIPTSHPRAVHILDLSNTVPTLQTTLTGHDKDAVICMRQLPNGDLLTGGGKLDATLQLWSKAQLERDDPMDADTPSVPTVSAAHKTLTDVGYVFAIEVLPDAKKDSDYYAVAVARYNTVKIII